MSHIYLTHIFKILQLFIACKRVFGRAMPGTNMDAGGTPRGVIPEAQRPVKTTVQWILLPCGSTVAQHGLRPIFTSAFSL